MLQDLIFQAFGNIFESVGSAAQIDLWSNVWIYCIGQNCKNPFCVCAAIWVQFPLLWTQREARHEEGQCRAFHRPQGVSERLWCRDHQCPTQWQDKRHVQQGDNQSHEGRSLPYQQCKRRDCRLKSSRSLTARTWPAFKHFKGTKLRCHTIGRTLVLVNMASMSSCMAVWKISTVAVVSRSGTGLVLCAKAAPSKFIQPVSSPSAY